MGSAGLCRLWLQSCCREGPQTPGQTPSVPPPLPTLPARPIVRSVLCRKEETVTVYPADVVLFEGILAFYSQEVRDLFQMKLFVDTDADTRLSRRGAFGAPGGPVGGPAQPRPISSGTARCPNVW